MNPDTLEQELREILREIRPLAPHESVGADDDIFDTLGLDSLDVSNLIVEIGYRYSVDIDIKDLPQVRTLRNLQTFMESAARALPREVGGGVSV
jgi:acyl carrier protein